MTDIPIKIQFVKSLSTAQPSRIVAVKADGDTNFTLYVTDKNGLPFPLKETSSGIVTAIQNTDGKLVITGSDTKTINVAPALLSLINSALQAGDNVSELVNDANYITLADIPAFVASDYDLEDFTNAGADPYAHLSDLSTGITNLDYIPSPTQGIVTSDTGSDATIPLADGMNAGLLEPSKYTILENTSGTNTGDQDLSGKQDNLVSGTNIKTIEGQSLLGSGNIDLAKSDVGLSNVDNTSDSNKPISTATQTALDGKQAALGYTPENVTNKSDSYTTSSSITYASTAALVGGLATKQNTLTNPVTGTGASGQVSFWSGSGTQTGNNTLFWDNTNKRLGIGESTPLDALVVSKTVGANTGQIRFGGSNGRTLSAYNNGSLGNFDFMASLSYFSGNLGIGSKRYISFYNYAETLPNYYQTIIDASENVSFRINGTNAYVISPNRNVLINTTTDNATDKLQINGTVSSGTTTLGNTPPTSNNQLTRKDYVDLKAPLASPTFTGTPTAPTAPAGTNTTQIATTAFVDAGLATKQNTLTNPVIGVGSNLDPTTYALQDGTILYHSVKWFAPTGAVSTSGTTVTSVGTQFTSAMVGAKLKINGEWRVITAFTSSTVVTVASAYSQNYSGVIAGSWGVYKKAVEILNNGNINIDGGQPVTFGHDTSLFSFISKSGGYKIGATGLIDLAADGSVRFSNTNGLFSTTRDLGLRRNSAGLLEIYDGVTADGALLNRRDLLVRNVYSEPATLPNQVVTKAQLDLKAGLGNAFTVGRIPFTSSASAISDSSKLLWNNTNSYFEVNGNAPRFTLKNNINNYSTYFTNDANGTLFLKNHQDKTLAVFNNPVWSTDQPQMSIGNVSSIPTESQLYVYGGMNGANIDARGSIDRDEANIDLEGNDWETSPNSLGFSYFGSNSTAFGTMLGYPKNKLGIIRFQDTNYAIINSEKIGGISPIRFGINDIEIGNVNDKGFSYQSDFSSVNSSNPRWLADKEYVDTKAPLSGSTNYIQNQNAAPQTANMWISGSANFGTGTSTTTLNGKEIRFYNAGASPAILKVADDATSINSIELFKSGAVANVVVPNGTVTASNGTLIGGTLTSGYIPKATGANSLGNSLIYDNGTNVGIGTASPSEKLEVTGTIKATSYTGSATLTGTPTAPTAAPGTTGNQIATLDFVLANAQVRPYKVYTALLSQTGTSAPVATVLENTLGGTVVWSRNSAGAFYGTLSAGVFTANKTVKFATLGYTGISVNSTIEVENANTSLISVITRVNGTKTDGVMSNGGTSIEIRVYN